MKKFLTLFTFSILFLIIFAGCSGDPLSISPDSQNEVTPAITAQDMGEPSHHLLGYSLLEIDTSTGGIDVIPVRSAKMHLNLTGIFNGSMGLDAAGVPGESNLAAGLLVMDISMTHPFPTLGKFSGFDVRGILMAPGSLPIGPLIFSDPAQGETRLRNADGYTRWWNPAEFTSPGVLGYIDGMLAAGNESQYTATVNPYKYFADVLGPLASMAYVTDQPMDSDTGRGVFRAGSVNTRRYEIQFEMNPGPKIVYGYAIDCSWAAPTVNPPAQIPDDFPIAANQHEPYRVTAIPKLNSLYYDNEASYGGGMLELQINVYDWQGQQAGDVAGEIDTVRLFSPDLWSGGVNATVMEETPVKAKYSIDLSSLAQPTHSGLTLIAVKVVPSTSVPYKQGPPAAPDADIAAWQVLTLDIPDPECTGDANNDWIEAELLQPGEYVIDQICLSDDYRDFYYFELDNGDEITGAIDFICDAEPSTLGLYDETHTLIEETSVTGGNAVISLYTNYLYPGKYYLRLYTSNNTLTAPYMLDFDTHVTTLDPTDATDITPDYLFFDPTKIWCSGNYLIAPGQNGVWVYDVSDPDNPEMLSCAEVDPGMFGFYSTFCWPYMYYSINPGGGALQIISMVDFTDPYSPEVHENVFQISSDPGGIIMNSTHLYVLDTEFPSNVHVYDISTPETPVYVDQFPSDYPIYSIGLFDPEGPDTKLLLATHQHLTAYDVEDPSSVTVHGTVNYDEFTPWEMVVVDDLVYVSGRDSGTAPWFYIIHIADPNIVQILSNVDFPAGFTGDFLDVKFPYAYIGSADAGLAAVNISSPTPGVEYTIPLGSQGGDIAISGNYAYIINKAAGVEIFDITTPPAVIYDHIYGLNRGQKIVPVGDYLLISEQSSFYNAINTVDVSDPANAFVVTKKFFAKMENIGAMSYDNNVLAVRLGGKTCFFDASDPTDLVYDHSVSNSNMITDIVLKGDVLYYTQYGSIVPTERYLSALDINSGIVEDENPLASHPSELMAEGDYIYVICSTDIPIYHIDSPLELVYADSYAAPNVMEIGACGDYLYLLTEFQLEIASLSNPADPSHVSTFSTGFLGSNINLSIQNQLGFIFGGEVNPFAVWLYPPGAPTNAGDVLDQHYNFNDVYIDNSNIYGVNNTMGLFVFDLY